MAKVQKTYTREFKEEAVRLAQTSVKPIAQIARELGISASAIHGWRKELTEHGKDAFPGKGHQTELEEENRRLKRELERVQQERDILKKLWASFRGNPNAHISLLNSTNRNFRLSSCAACLMSRKVAFLPGESVLSVNANEKMPNSPKRFDKNLALIRADTGAHACMPSCVIGDEASRASALPG
jgi:transposase